MAIEATFFDLSSTGQGQAVPRSILPPPVVIPAPGTGSLGPSITINGVRLETAQVRGCAAELAQRARALGADASLRVWRDAHFFALAQLTRESAGLATGVRCLSLTWERKGDAYYVSAAFAAPRPTLH